MPCFDRTGQSLGGPMSPKAIFQLSELLINRRREIFEQVEHMESECSALGQRVVEPFDKAQNDDLTCTLYRLIERGKEEIREINLSIAKHSAFRIICKGSG